MKKTKAYLITVIIQIIVITIFIISNFFALKYENIVLNPFLYILPFGILLLITDVISVVITFVVLGKKSKEELDDDQKD